MAVGLPFYSCVLFLLPNPVFTLYLKIYTYHFLKNIPTFKLSPILSFLSLFYLQSTIAHWLALSCQEENDLMKLHCQSENDARLHEAAGIWNGTVRETMP